MADFSIGDVAFTGFRIISQRPKVFAIWAGAQIALSLLTTALMLAAFGSAFIQLKAATVGGRTDPTATMEAFRHLVPAFALGIPFFLMMYAIIYAAMNRAILRPADNRFAYLRIGPDEFRQLGLMLLLGVTIVGLELVALLVWFTLSAAASGLGVAPSFLVRFVGGIGAFCAIVFVGVRLCLASPLTFATGKVNLFGSWKLTKGRFWPLLGTAAVVFFVTFGLDIVLGVLNMVLSGVSNANATAALTNPGANVFALFFTPGQILIQIIGAVFGAALMPLWMTPPAAIYAQITGDLGGLNRVEISDVFS